jgi:hypothetical protein
LNAGAPRAGQIDSNELATAGLSKHEAAAGDAASRKTGLFSSALRVAFAISSRLSKISMASSAFNAQSGAIPRGEDRMWPTEDRASTWES